jgi:autotransporter-associated beta strand protein
MRPSIFSFSGAAIFWLGVLLIEEPVFAGSATWLANPISSNWGTDANWTPMTSPCCPGDIATFQTSSQTSVSLANAIEFGGIVFAPGANQFTITTGGQYNITISGAGITNNSGALQTIVTNGWVTLTNFATAGNLITVQGGFAFAGSANAGSATFNGGAIFNNSASATSANINGSVAFRNLSTAADAHIAVGDIGVGNYAHFSDSSTAGNSTITADNSSTISFSGSSTAGTATLNANHATIAFNENSTGEMSRVILSNDMNNVLDISGHAAPGVSVGSIEGYGTVFLGNRSLTVGANNSSTTFSGHIQDSVVGSVVKVGTGTLTLTNSNAYRAGTSIDDGTLRASHDSAFSGVGGSISMPNYVSVAPGATLTLDSGVTNDYIDNLASLIVATGSTVNLNFTGNPDRVRSLIVDGVTQPPGIYGGPLSGAPNQLPQFNGTGTIIAAAKAVSRKVHGDAGAFDIDLPFAGGPGIECRDGTGEYQVVVTFINNVTFSYVSILGTGYVSSYDGSGTNTVTANLAGVGNVQVIYITLHDLNDGSGPTNWAFPMGVLIGDVNGNRTVNASDVVAVKTQLGQPATASNFRVDVNPNGIVNASDLLKVKSLLGTTLP